MKVKVGNTVYDGAEQLVMVILSPGDKKNIAMMLPEATMYCEGPETIADEEFEKFMGTEDGLRAKSKRSDL